MGRPGGPGPLDPIFDVPTSYGSIAIGNTPPTLFFPPTVTINQAASQGDPSTVVPVLFTVVFSEAVTGFVSGEVTLSGTANATTATVVDSGDHITYTVQVTGMANGGTVTAVVPAGVATAISSGLANSASTSTDNTVTWVDPLSWFGDSAAGVNPTISPTYTGQSLALCMSCITRLNAEEAVGVTSTADGYGGGTATGFDGFGLTGAQLLLGAEFGTRSRMSMRQDWLNFLDGDEYRVTLSSADHAVSTAFYKLEYPWKVKQMKCAATATTALSVTLDNPVSANSVVIIGVACLSANSVLTGPAGFTADGTTDEPTQRTSRMSAYRSTGTDQSGVSNYTATLLSSTGGGAIMAIEIAQEDSLDTALSTAIRAQSGLLNYYPIQHTLGGIEKNWDGSLGVFNLSFQTGSGGWDDFNVDVGADGRNYGRHVSATFPGTFADNTEFTPNGNGGMTVGFLVNPTTLAALQAIVSKNTNAANFNKEWEVYINTDGSLTARTCNGASTPAASARQRTSAAGLMTTGTWYFVIIRFGNGANDFPTIRVNGVDITGTTSGSTSANANSAAVPAVGGAYQNSASRAAQSGIGHVFYVTTDISDGECAVLEAAAQADGWF